MNDITLELDAFAYSPTSLQIVGQPTFEEWQETGEYLVYICDAVQWWIGDWLNYGEGQYPEKWTQVLDGKDYVKGTRTKTKNVAKRVQPAQRNENLSYPHHVTVASLDPELQERFLNLADSEGLTVNKLRQKIKALKMQDSNSKDEYKKMVGKIINMVDVLTENYPSGIDEIKLYLEE